jgi:putative SOS response-associated peptidase YedK
VFSTVLTTAYNEPSQRSQIHQVRGWRNVRPREWRNEEAFVPRHNIAPHSNGVVMRRDESQDGGLSEDLVLQTMKWGLVPHWCKHEDKTLNTINARAENLATDGGMWASIKGRKRCVVIIRKNRNCMERYREVS